MTLARSPKRIVGEKYKAVLSNRIYLSREAEFHEHLLKHLNYTLPPKQPGLPNETYCDVTRINENILTIPIGRTDLIPDTYEIIDKRTYNEVKFPKFKFKLRDDQVEIYDEVNDSCIIQANPSWGKTFTGIAIATKLSQKTVVIVHTLNLFEQWRNEVEKTLGIKAGVIGDSKYNIDSPIVIASARSLKNRISNLRDEFGTVIVDECHHLPANTFKNFVDNLKARYKIGLTATPWRKDGKHVILKDYTGLDYHVAPDMNRRQAKIIIVNTDIPFSTNSNIPWATRVNELLDDPRYIELVLNLSQAQAELGHKVLTVSDRVEFLETCGDILTNFKTIVGTTQDRSFDPDREDGIFGSIKIFSEGVNIPPLSCLITAVPVNNRALLEQLIGRIERPYEDKLDPVVLDIWLTGKTAKYQQSQRINYYMDRGYKIEYI